jgi:hypothetical protein
MGRLTSRTEDEMGIRIMANRDRRVNQPPSLYPGSPMSAQLSLPGPWAWGRYH